MAIPIIGQPTIEDFEVSIVVGCPCGKKFLLSGQVNVMRACPNKECDKVYKLSAVPVIMRVGNTPQQMAGVVVMSQDLNDVFILLSTGKKIPPQE